MMRASLIRSGALFGAAALGLFAIFYGLAVLSYSAADAAYNSAAADVQHNWMGQSGAYLADAMLFVFGIPSIFLFPLLLVFARRLWRDVPQPQWKRQLSYCLIGMLLIGFAMAYWQHGSDIGLPAGWGGAIALLLDNAAVALVGQIKGIFGTLLRVFLIVGGLAGGVALVIRSLQLERPLLRIPALGLPKFANAKGDTRVFDGDDLAPQILEPKPPRKAVEPDQRKPPVIEDRTLAPKKAAFSTGARQGDFFGSFTLPSLELLDPPPSVQVPKLDKTALEANARLLESVLDDFHVKGQIVAVRPGPVVTMYELEPAAGIKSSRVIQLAEDIARNMSALSARVSTIPGRTVMGIELPNAHREAVVFQEMVGSDAFAEQKGALPIILGKNISGDPVIADLAPMPHLLVAGTTGSGKLSRCAPARWSRCMSLSLQQVSNQAGSFSWPKTSRATCPLCPRAFRRYLAGRSWGLSCPMRTGRRLFSRRWSAQMPLPSKKGHCRSFWARTFQAILSLLTLHRCRICWSREQQGRANRLA